MHGVQQVSPPVLGFNNNVRHRGRVFHIQTEDSGVKTPRIVTHLFADGGRIIKTARKEYSELVGRTDVQQLVRQMMKDQHKAMFSALRHGELDALLETSCGPLPLPPERRAESAPVSAVPSHAPESAAAPRSVSVIGLANPNLHKITPSVPPPSKEAIDQAVLALTPPEEATRVTPKPAPVKEAAASAAPPARKSRPPANSISGRPRANAQASSRSIFGEGVISEKSLDEVILSYLAEDLDGQSE